jgi:hypothetical protein
MNNIPEEIEAMAFLIGQSNQIDQMMVDRPSTLITSAQTLKKGMNEYIQTQRQQAPQPVQYQQPQQLPQVPQYAPMPQKVDDGQLELNLEPTKVEEIIILLKEISNKLTKQNSLLEKTYANQSKQKTVSEPVVKLVANK